MKKFAVLAATFFCVFLANGSAFADLRFGVMNEPYAPFFKQDASGKWEGWEIDMMNAVCAQMKEKCTIVPISWDGLIPALQSKKIDVIWSSMTITGKREKVIDFTDKYYNTGAMLIGSKGVKSGVAPADLAGKTIATQVSSIQSDYFKKYFADKSKEKTYQTVEEMYQDLSAGRVDYVFSDGTSLLEFLKTDFGKGCCAVAGSVKDDQAILGKGVGGGVRKSDGTLKNKINAAIKAIRSDGEYMAISKKYFDYDPYVQ
ncbi:transporter substrate-binding domain-containing protein [Burkholderia sp. MR1-5-21]